MINYREIFNIKYGFIGVIIILVLMILLILLDKKKGIKNIIDSFLISSFFMLVIYVVGLFLVNSLRYRVFVEVISNTFFTFIAFFGIICFCIGGMGFLFYKYVS